MHASRFDIRPITGSIANSIIVDKHYLHRRVPTKYAFGLFNGNNIDGVVTYSFPMAKEARMSVAPHNPHVVLELSRLWVDDIYPKNTESKFVAATLKMLPPSIVISYADLSQPSGNNDTRHEGYIYRALNFKYAGWTDMDQPKPRFNYVHPDDDKNKHPFMSYTRHNMKTMTADEKKSFRVDRSIKARYWTTTGNKRERKILAEEVAWLDVSWKEFPPPIGSEDHKEKSSILWKLHQEHHKLICGICKRCLRSQ